MTEINELRRILADHEKRIKKLETAIRPIGPKKQKHVDESKSIIDLLIELKDAGFFKQPRLIGEIVEKMAEMTYHYSSQSLTSPLQRAIRKHILGRIKKESQWAYVAR